LEFAELKDLGFDTSLTGFDELQLSTILKEPNFEPGTEDDQGKLDEKAKQQCPNCGHEF
jgi:hypothetical protein